MDSRRADSFMLAVRGPLMDIIRGNNKLIMASYGQSNLLNIRGSFFLAKLSQNFESLCFIPRGLETKRNS